MKKLYPIIVALLVLAGLGSCSEDKGNYDYDWIPGVSISALPQHTVSYQVGDALVLRPVLSFTKNGEEASGNEDIFSEDEYEYYWIASRYVSSLGRIVSDTIGRGRNLNYIVSLAPDEYLVEYQVCNKTSDVKWLGKFKLNVSLSAPEGWVLLEEDGNGQAELSIYARMGDGSMRMVRNLLANSGIPSSALAGPRQVFATYQNSVGSGVWILTDHFTGFLNVKEGHRWNERQVVRRHLVENVGDDFIFNKMVGVMFFTVLGFSDDGLRISRYPGMLYTADVLPLPENGRFEVAPYACVIGDEIQTKQILFFDETNKCFKLLDLSGNIHWTEADKDFPSGYDLMFMQTIGINTQQKIFCLLKKDGEVYQVMASSAIKVDQTMKISNSEKFLNAGQVVYHMFLQMPYYLYDNKLYVNTGSNDLELEYYVEPEGNTGSSGPVQTELEGRITCIATKIFPNVDDADGYKRRFMNYLVVATELEDGSGKVYFLTPEPGNAYKMTVSDVANTNHKVVSIDYQYLEIIKEQ